MRPDQSRKEPWRAAFDLQATPALLEKVHRATRARMQTYAGRRYRVPPEDIDDMMNRARDDARRRWRNRLETEELEEETTDVSLGEQLVAGASPRRPDDAYLRAQTRGNMSVVR